MSKYTTEVRFICETAAGLTESEGYNKVSEIIEAARPNVFSFEYPIFDAAYKGTLETKILKHYYTREIGAETVGLWRLWLDRRMNEIMPYFNQLYESARLEFQPFYDVDYTRTGTDTEDMSENGQTTSVNSGSDTTSATHNATGTNKGTNWDYYSDTPQGSVANIDNNTYLTNARKTTNDTAVTDTANDGSTTTYGMKNNGTDARTRDTDRAHAETVRGKMGGSSYSAMLKEYRETFLNIDMLVIEALSDLFMKLW